MLVSHGLWVAIAKYVISEFAPLALTGFWESPCYPPKNCVLGLVPLALRQRLRSVGVRV